jgi:Asp-tRNA(Asn)/Glu-tRNA(Gln) amidotransferase A subunit family amidase
MLSLRTILVDIAAGRLTPAEALARSRAIIERLEPEIGAFASLSEEDVVGEGPLAGIAVGVKDIIDTADLPTGMGSAIYPGWQPKADAPIVCAVRAAGATVIGKTETTAFAHLDPARTHNPHHPDVTPGGSSAGSAAAVAAGMIPLAIGTQTGGSVIRPASYCGVAAIKPSFGILPTVGIKPFSWSLDTPGLFAASADDLACALAQLTGRLDLDGSVPALRGLRIGVARQPFAGPAEAASEAALDAAAARARAQGATVVDLPEPEAFANAFEAHLDIQAFEATQALAWEYRHHREAIAPKLRAYLDEAHKVTPAAYDAARRLSRRGRDAARAWFGQTDAILTYAAPGVAPLRASTGEARFNRLWTLLGVPCIGLPMRAGAGALPVSVQVLTAFGRDAEALAVARAMERAAEPDRGTV